jgi:hypothetical protein
MEFAESARKHYAENKLCDDGALHAIRTPLRLVEQEGDYQGRLLIIGFDQSTRLLEVVVVPSCDPDLIIHVNTLQPKNYIYL